METTITYDTIGNPTKFGYYDRTWQGRELQSWSDDETTTIYYGYNADGIRTYKEIVDWECINIRYNFYGNEYFVLRDVKFQNA